MQPAFDREAGAEAVHSRSQRGAAYFEAALPRHHESREQTASSCTAAAEEIATPLKHRTRPRGKIVEWFSEQRGSRNKQ